MSKRYVIRAKNGGEVIITDVRPRWDDKCNCWVLPDSYHLFLSTKDFTYLTGLIPPQTRDGLIEYEVKN